mmetsp:Transcript_17881/g.57833  ORF Transcript_17881/g.57833 Transcript_17881/m.57833 type:complete len:476 (-) Transcript_17881:396-1823(-)
MEPARRAAGVRPSASAEGVGPADLLAAAVDSGVGPANLREVVPPPPPPMDPARRAERESAIAAASSIPPASTVPLAGNPFAPSLWFYDWSRRSPLDVNGVEDWLAARLRDVVLPAGWISALVRDEDTPLSPWDVDDPETVALGDAFARMIEGARSRRTLTTYRAPFLKLALWLALRAYPLSPPTPRHVGLYLTAIVVLRRNGSAAETAARALEFVGWLNEWPSLSSNPACRLPVEASLRAFNAPKPKSAPLQPWMLVAIVRGTADGPAWQRMLAWAMLACYMCVGRFSDLCRLQWGDGWFEDHPWGLRFFLDKRKTDQRYDGQWIDIADNASCAAEFDGFSAVSELRKARRLLGHAGGPVLRSFKGNGRPGERRLVGPFFPADHDHAGAPRHLTRGPFQDHMQAFLGRFCNLPPADAKAYTTHGLRIGAATSMVRHKVPDHIVKARAGVTSDDWIGEYDRVDLPRRLDCSLALGL